MKGILITGTDTGVGKTRTTLQIIKTAQKSGLRVAAIKPFETGCRLRGNKLVPLDALQLMKACGMDDMNTVNPYRFNTPAAPFIAARLENILIDVRKIKKIYRELSLRNDLIVVEGAGGLLVPVTKHLSYADLAKELSLSVLVVSANKLGVINHTLLTVDSIKARGLNLLGVVLNDRDKKDDMAKRTNAYALSTLLGTSFIGEIKFNQSGNGISIYEKILKLARK